MRLGPTLWQRGRSLLRRSCWPTLPFLFAVLGIGLAVQWSVTPDQSFPSGHALRLVALGICAVIAMLYGVRRWRRHAYFIYAASLFLLLLVLLIGRETNSARRWIDLFAGFKLQPSEFMKLALIVALSKWFADHPRPQGLRDLWKPVAMTAVPAFLILIEPDLGTALVFAPLLLSMVWVVGLPKRSMRWLLLLPALIAPAGWFFIQDYQKERILTWWHQDQLTEAEIVDEGYHLWHAKLAVGTGGWTGFGWGEGPENRLDRLPERHNDFVFPVIAEEGGLLGAGAFVLLYMGMAMALLWAAARHRDPFTRFVLAGIGSHFLIHLILNAGVTMGVWPTTGLPLPLISFGGSSMIVSGLALGLALAVSANRDLVLSSKAFEA